MHYQVYGIILQQPEYTKAVMYIDKARNFNLVLLIITGIAQGESAIIFMFIKPKCSET